MALDLTKRVRWIFVENNPTHQVFVIIVFYLVLLSLHLLMCSQMKGPLLSGDEMGYLGNARYLWGKGFLPALGMGTSIHAGYSLLISPAFWFSSEPKETYLLVLVMNSFLISLIFPILYCWLRTIFSLDFTVSLWASFLVSLYPPFLLHSNIAWAENALIPLFLVPSILIYFMFKRESVSLGFLFGVSVSILYAVHPRALLIVPIAAFYLTYLALRKLLPLRMVVASWSSSLLGVVATLKLHGHLKCVTWESVGSPVIKKSISTYPNWDSLGKFFIGAAGQLWYLTASTYGLFVVGCFLFCFTIWRNRRALSQKTSLSGQTHALLFCGLSSAAVWILSIVFLSSFEWNVERLIYGRYNECFAAAFMALALGMILTEKGIGQWRKTMIRSLLLGFFGLGFIISLVEVNRIGVLSMIPVNVHGLFPILGTLIYKLKFSFVSAVLTTTLFFLLAMMFLARAFRLCRSLGIFSLASLFLVMGVSQYFVLCLPVARWVDSLSLPKVIRSLPDIRALSLDQAGGWPREFYQYQYFLPHIRFLPFNTSKGASPGSDYFISSRFSQAAPKTGARIVAFEGEGDLALWVRHGGLEKEGDRELERSPFTQDIPGAGSTPRGHDPPPTYSERRANP